MKGMAARPVLQFPFFKTGSHGAADTVASFRGTDGWSARSPLPSARPGDAGWS